MTYRNDRTKVKDYFRNNEQELIHVEHVLDLLHVLSGDSRFGVIKKRYEDMEESEKGECKKMCLLLDAIEEEGIEKGIKKGRKEGKAEEKEANIKKLAAYYMNNASSLSKEKAMDMARLILE